MLLIFFSDQQKTEWHSSRGFPGKSVLDILIQKFFNLLNFIVGKLFQTF